MKKQANHGIWIVQRFDARRRRWVATEVLVTHHTLVPRQHASREEAVSAATAWRSATGRVFARLRVRKVLAG